jgi:hypothetical protein
MKTLSFIVLVFFNTVIYSQVVNPPVSGSDPNKTFFSKTPPAIGAFTPVAAGYLIYASGTTDPAFPGGFDQWQDFIEDNVKTLPVSDVDVGPYYAKSYRFIATLTPDGTFIDIDSAAFERTNTPIEVVKEITRILKMSPKWIPSKAADGKALYFRYPGEMIIPISKKTKTSTAPVTQSTKQEKPIDSSSALNQSSTANKSEPLFPGGKDAWEKYIAGFNTLANSGAPVGKYALKVSVTIDKDGKISNTKILNDPGYGSAMDAALALKQSPRWIPAMQNGKPIEVDNFTISFVFEVKEE